MRRIFQSIRLQVKKFNDLPLMWMNRDRSFEVDKVPLMLVQPGTFIINNAINYTTIPTMMILILLI